MSTDRPFAEGDENSRTYENPHPLDHETAEQVFAKDDPVEIARTIVGAALHDQDGAWVQSQALQLTRRSDSGVRSAAAIALGHLARIHGYVDKEAVVPVLRTLAEDPRTRGAAENALEDIHMFVTTEDA